MIALQSQSRKFSNISSEIQTETTHPKLKAYICFTTNEHEILSMAIQAKRR